MRHAIIDRILRKRGQNMNMHLRMAVLDLDRTLLREDKRISDHTLRVLARCREKGVKIMIASARPMRTLAEYIAILRPDAMASANGAVIRAPGIERRFPLDREQAEGLLRLLVSAYPDLRVSAEIDDTLYANFDLHGWAHVRMDASFPKLPAGDILKILLTCTDEERQACVRGLLTQDMRATVADQKLMQIQSVRARKWNAVEIMAARWGISRAEIACFGDDWDDIEMLKNAGLGVAVENAIEPARAAADLICKSNEQDGPARVLARLIGKEAGAW